MFLLRRKLTEDPHIIYAEESRYYDRYSNDEENTAYEKQYALRNLSLACSHFDVYLQGGYDRDNAGGGIKNT